MQYPIEEGEAPMNLSDWTITRIENVVHITTHDVDPGFVQVNDTHVKRFGARKYHGLVYRYGGESLYVVENRFQLLNAPGTLLYLPQGREYYVQQKDRGDCFCVNFYLDSDPVCEPFLIQPRYPEKWAEDFSAMVRCYLGHSVGWRARLNAYLYNMFAALDEDRSARYLSKHHVSMIRARMAQLEGNLASETSIAALAADCGICETYFRRVFRDIYGLSPKQYIQSVRFRQARALLDGSDVSIAYIAEACGFENLYHFSRAFRAYEGISPSEYRRRRAVSPAEDRTP